jgi:predicted chitinase
MAGPLEPRIETRTKWGRFKSSKKAKNAPLVYCAGGIPLGKKFSCEGKSCVALPGEYMWPENPDGSDGSPSDSAQYKGYSILTDFNVYTPMYTSGGKGSTGDHWSGYNAGTFARESWNELQSILTKYGIQPSKKIIVGFSGGVAFVTNNIATFGGSWNYWNTILLAGAWAPNAGNEKPIQNAKKQNPNTYYFSGGLTAGSDNFDNPGYDATAKLFGKDFIKTSGNHMSLVPTTANWIKNNIQVSSTGEAATPSGFTPSAETGTKTKDGTSSTTTPTTTTTATNTGDGVRKPSVCDLLKDDIPERFMKELPTIIDRFKIDNMTKLIHFLAQCMHESGNFRYTEEIASGERYEGRKDLGNNQPGDGKKFKGRGLIQLTGRTNYKAFAKWIGEDVVTNPELVATKYPFISAGYYWETHWSGNLFDQANAGLSDAVIVKITKRINGGTNGLEDRRKKTKYLEQKLAGKDCINCGETGSVISSSVTEANGTDGQVSSASNDCNDLTKDPAKEKSNESPEGAALENVAKDPLPPAKDETPVSIDGKYNHRFYILPTKENKPLPLADMVSDKKKYAKRCWAWRTDEGPGYGYKENENKLTTTDGKSLVSGLVPYWPAYSGSLEPGSGSFDIDKLEKPKVNGSWKQLLEGQKQIQSFLDVPVLLNAYDVGVYNDNIGYIFEAGNELHMTILEKVFLTNKGSQIGIGNAINTTISDKKNKDSSWREWPKWSGIWVSHCLKNSGYSLNAEIDTNINTYHEKILEKKQLINYPGNKEWKWKDLKAAGIQDLVFKPSKIWYDPVNLNSDELLKETGDIAIFIVDYHIKKDGTLTDKGQKLLDKVLSLNWKLAVISAVKSHTGQSNQLYAEVLVYLDKTGKMVTFGGNTTPRGADSIPGGGPYHIAVKETNFKDFAILAGDNWVNGAVFISNVKSAPEGHRVGGLDSKIYTTDIFKDYYTRIDAEKGKLTGRMYNFLLPYIDQKPAAPAPKPAEKTLEQENFTPSPLTNAGNDPGSGEQLMGSVKELIAKGLLRKMETYKGSTSEAGQAYPGLLTGGPWNSFHAMSAESVKAGVGAITTGHDAFRTYADQYSKWVNAGGSKSPPWKGPTSKNATPGGSFHGKGRAVDISGTTGGTLGKGGNLDAYRKKMSPLQNFAFKYGIPFGWYNYFNEVWHFNYKHDKTLPGKNISLWTKGG